MRDSQMPICNRGNIAPEIDLRTINPAAHLQESPDIDSMDFLNFVAAIHHRFRVGVLELGLKFSTLYEAVAYIETKLNSSGS